MKNYTKTTIVKFESIGHTGPSLFGSFMSVTSVYFQTEFGRLVYYDAQEKWEKLPQFKFHNDILDAAAGKNSGYFQGLTVEKKKKNDDLYLEAGPKCRLLTMEEASLLKNK